MARFGNFGVVLLMTSEKPELELAGLPKQLGWPVADVLGLMLPIDPDLLHRGHYVRTWVDDE